jgi:hypothetical protein
MDEEKLIVLVQECEEWLYNLKHTDSGGNFITENSYKGITEEPNTKGKKQLSWYFYYIKDNLFASYDLLNLYVLGKVIINCQPHSGCAV